MNMRKKHNIDFTKAVASGNDFIIIDDKNGDLKTRNLDYSEIARELCPRHTSVGADGILVLEASSKADFRMRIINPDGSEVAMCGNGTRCSALYAAMKEWGNDLTIETGAGILRAEVKGKEIKVKMSDPKDADLEISLGLGNSIINVSFINTGVPHVVHFVEDLAGYPVKDTGRKIREHSFFLPEGTNVNFVEKTDDNEISVRTYERGVEDETLSCGTGTVASAVVSGLMRQVVSPVNVRTSSGEILEVFYQVSGKKVSEVYLNGSADIIFKGGI